MDAPGDLAQILHHPTEFVRDPANLGLELTQLSGHQ